ncbi:hypothetical protein HanIR_Chr13g0656661 [Helianthus annuus]|nr:hypothetical protein HanIR_Chr13g0656661 [Helianthus annuus]
MIFSLFSKVSNNSISKQSKLAIYSGFPNVLSLFDDINTLFYTYLP